MWRLPIPNSKQNKALFEKRRVTIFLELGVECNARLASCNGNSVYSLYVSPIETIQALLQGTTRGEIRPIDAGLFELTVQVAT
jgi:hypothetical protein